MKSFNIGLDHETLVCARCGYCQAVCPVYKTLGWESTGPRGRIAIARQAAQGAPLSIDHEHRVYQCTLCGHCRAVCPTHIDTCDLWLDLRGYLADHGSIARWQLRRIRDNLIAHHNITGDVPENRLLWQQNLETEIPGLNLQAHAQVVYFVGCVAGLYPQTQGIPQALSQILAKAQIDFTTLGSAEECCGFPLLGMGLEDAAADLARRNVARAKESDASVLVAACPSCYHTWRDVYPRLLGAPIGLQVKHTSEFLVDLLTEHQLSPQPFKARVTYHDPCDLGRNSGVYDPPRQVLKAIPGLELVEMVDHRENALCCGGGGNVEVIDPDLVAAIARRRLAQASETGANFLVTPCPQCKRTLANAARTERARLQVLDLNEFACRAL